MLTERFANNTIRCQSIREQDNSRTSQFTETVKFKQSHSQLLRNAHFTLNITVSWLVYESPSHMASGLELGQG